MMGHPRTIQQSKVFVATYKLNYQQETMLNTQQKNLGKIGFILSGLLSQNIHAKNLFQETGVGTRGTSHIKNKKNFLDFSHFDHDEFPEATAEITLDNGMIIKLAFEAYLESLLKNKISMEKTQKTDEDTQGVEEWIFNNLNLLHEKVNSSNWSLKEFKLGSKDIKEESKLNFQFTNDLYLLSCIQDPEENDFDIKRNIIHALSFLLKNQGTPYSIEEIEKELQKKIFTPEIKFF